MGHLLRQFSLAVASLVVLIVVLAVLSPAIRQLAVQPLTWVAAGVGVVLFVRTLFDPKAWRAILASSGEIHAIPYRRLPLHPEWGIFGKRTADQPLRTVRGILFIEFAIAMPFIETGKDILLLAFAGLMVASQLSIIPLGDHSASAKDGD